MPGVLAILIILKAAGLESAKTWETPSMGISPLMIDHDLGNQRFNIHPLPVQLRQKDAVDIFRPLVRKHYSLAAINLIAKSIEHYARFNRAKDGTLNHPSN